MVSWTRLARLLGVLLLCAAGVAPAPAAAPLDPVQVSRWADAFVGEGLRLTGTPGAVIVVVQDGRIVLARGYGLADPARRRPVDPERTLFRIGSITKLFTAAVAVQMQQEGRLDFRRDVNAYLDRFQLPLAFGRPVTADDLLSHRGGFADDRRGRYGYPEVEVSGDPERMTGDQILRLMVPRTRAPGAWPSYDNHSFALMSLVEAAIDRASFRALVQRRIFAPLGMSHSVVGLPNDREAEAAVGHRVLISGALAPTGYDRQLELDGGSGDISSTGTDMARFMNALLSGGAPILSPAGFAEYTNFDARRLHPALPGLGRAIVESDVGQHRGWRHDGGMEGFGATFMLYPQSRIGVFLAVNARNSNPFAEERLSGILDAFNQFTSTPARTPVLEYFAPVHERFAERFVAEDRIPPVRRSGPLLAGEELARVAGTYGGDPADAAYFAGKLTLVALGGRTVRVTDGGDIMIGRRGPFRQVDRGLFVGADGERVAFRHDDAGDFFGETFVTAPRKRPWYASPLVSLAPLVLLPPLMLTGLLLLRASDRKYRRVGLGVALVALVAVGGMFLEGQYGNQFYEQDQMAPLAAWRIMLWLCAAAWVALPFYLRFGRNDGQSGRAAKIHAILLAAFGLILVPVFGYWHLLAWPLS